MKTAPIIPAAVDFSDASTPAAPAFGDVYHARAGAFAQAEHVFLHGNELPARWRGRHRFVVLETGFGLGNNFLATWRAWRDDPERSERLVFISVEKHPLRLEDLHRAHAASPCPELAGALVKTWPPLTHNLHRLEFEAGRVELLLAFGDARAWLAELVATVDAFYLDGFAPAKNPDIWDPYLLRSLGRLAAPAATLATWSSAGPVRDGLKAAGFEVRRAPGIPPKWHITVARFAPRHDTQRPAARLPLAPQARTALVIGAGLAGAACADALHRHGIASMVVDGRDGIARASSGNPGGLFHGTLNPDDGLHARFNRAAALATARCVAELAAAGALPWQQRGLLRLERRLDLGRMRALIARLGLPADYVQALDAGAAAALAGLPLDAPAWFYPAGGALDPAAYARALIERCGATVRLSCAVDDLRCVDGRWQALDAAGRMLAEADAVVLAGGHEGQVLLTKLAGTALPPLVQQRGQLTHLAPAAGPRLPVAGAGYALSDGGDGVWCGATTDDGDMEPALRAADQSANLAQWAALSGRAIPQDAPLAGRVGWRLIAPDRLPLVGGLPTADGASASGRADQPRFLSRRPGLVVCTAMASRGIGWAALCGELAAAQLVGAPLPLEASLVDAVDPARFAVRRARTGVN